MGSASISRSYLEFGDIDLGQEWLNWLMLPYSYAVIFSKGAQFINTDMIGAEETKVANFINNQKEAEIIIKV